jgi:AcrR family transcriptional regulator
MSQPSRTRQPNRVATESALQKAALLLLERNGVLAGLNLRQVADEAGVNRGLVYHYFGSRRDLLRAALRSDVRERSSMTRWRR